MKINPIRIHYNLKNVNAQNERQQIKKNRKKKNYHLNIYFKSNTFIVQNYIVSVFSFPIQLSKVCRHSVWHSVSSTSILSITINFYYIFLNVKRINSPGTHAHMQTLCDVLAGTPQKWKSFI